jgi:hypothetical protein
MYRLITIASASLLVTLVACSTTIDNSNPPGSSSGTSGTPGSPGSPGANGGVDGGPSTTTPPPSAIEGDVSVGGTCPTFAACGGSLDGTYDYTAGCITDVFASAREQCAALDTTNAKVVVSGTLYFTESALKRKATVKTSGSIVFPASCTAGQCATVEAALKSSFDSVTCSGSTDCTCTLSRTDTVDNATTFTVSGSTVTTGDNETYAICAKGDALDYSGKSAGSEEGFWSLKKR